MYYFVLGVLETLRPFSGVAARYQIMMEERHRIGGRGLTRPNYPERRAIYEAFKNKRDGQDCANQRSYQARSHPQFCGTRFQFQLPVPDPSCGKDHNW
jgi:hypothetical protein